MEWETSRQVRKVGSEVVGIKTTLATSQEILASLPPQGSNTYSNILLTCSNLCYYNQRWQVCPPQRHTVVTYYTEQLAYLVRTNLPDIQTFLQEIVYLLKYNLPSFAGTSGTVPQSPPVPPGYLQLHGTTKSISSTRMRTVTQVSILKC